MFRFLPLMIKNSWRNRRRTTLTVLSMTASLCLLGVLFSLYHFFYLTDAPPEQALRLITYSRVSLAVAIPLSYQQQIARVPGVRAVIPMQWFGGTYKDNRDFKNFFARFATDPNTMFVAYPEYKVPEDQKRAFQQERTACMIGRKLADRLNFKLGDRITIVGDIFPVNLEFIVRAIYDSRADNENLLFNREYLAQSLPPARRDLIGSFTVLADSPDHVTRIAQEIDNLFRNATRQTRTQTEQAFTLSFLAFAGNIKLFILAICGAVTFTILLVSGNTMAMSVRERVREIGILKTLGFTPGNIFGILLGEAVLLALIGGALGLGVTYLLLAGLRAGPTMLADMSLLRLEPSVMVICLVVAVLIGAISCFVPAWSSSRRSILDSLRFTD